MQYFDSYVRRQVARFTNLSRKKIRNHTTVKTPGWYAQELSLLTSRTATANIASEPTTREDATRASVPDHSDKLDEPLPPPPPPPYSERDVLEMD